MKRAASALLILVSLLAAGCQSAPAPNRYAAPAGDIVIASDLPVTHLYGDAIRAQEAIQLAVSQHRAMGRFKLVYWSLDDAVAGNYSQEKGIQNVSQMLDDPRVLGMVGPYNSDVAAVTIPVANPGDLAMISPSVTRICLTQIGPTCSYTRQVQYPSGRTNFFRIAPPDSLQGTAMARYAVSSLHIDRVAIINEWSGGGEPYVSYFIREFQRLGGEVVLREDVDPDTADFKDFLAEAHALQAQAIYAVGDTNPTGPAGICTVRAQMTDAAIFLGTDGFSGDPLCIREAAANSSSIFATKPDVDITGSKDPAAMAAVKAFHKAYPTSKIDQYTFAAYDCALILIDAIRRAIDAAHGSIPNRPQVLDALAQTQDFKGVTGTYSFDSNGDALSPLMSIYQVENGQWVYLNKVDASPPAS